MKITTYIIMLLLFLGLFQIAKAQQFDDVDVYARKVKKSRDFKKLSHELTDIYTDTTLKYRSIYTWITKNIKYDCNAFHNSSKIVSDPIKVVSVGKAVCSGYAMVFKELCTNAGLECEIIDGWSKNNYSTIGRKLAVEPDHSWNAIKIGGKWMLCDVTWGAGYTEGNCEKYVEQFQDFYFCSPPHLFALQHYPENREWFLGADISVDEFVNLPHYFPAALSSNTNLHKPENGIIKYKKNEKQTFSFETDFTGEITVMMLNSNEPLYNSIANSSKSQQIEVVFKKYSPYILIFFGTEGAMAFKVER